MAVAKEATAVKPQLPPGFRFRPTDEELVVHYLRRRALGCPLPAAVDIPDIRLLAHDPSDLLPPGWTEPERYFFTCKEAKYVKGRRANRATGDGYWKATGKEKPVAAAVPVPGAGGQPVLVGMKRSLVFYRGKPPTGSKTEWVIHEYRLAGAGLLPCRPRVPPQLQAQAQAQQQRVALPPPRAPAEGWVLCRVFRKMKGAAARRADEEEEEEEAQEEVVVAEEEEEAEEDAGAPGPGFIDFFARADAAARQGQDESSSCLTDASHHQQQQQQQQQQQETTSSRRLA